jgi:PKD repeat protein
MKKLFLAFPPSVICLAIAIGVTSVSATAQSNAIIGTGSSSNTQNTYPAPYGNYYWGAKHQILVRASEMTAVGMVAGNISALAFQVNLPEGTALSGFTIRMKTTAATTAGAAFDNTGLTTVYGPQAFTDASGWNTHTFSTPFAWNGTSNLLIETCFNNPTWSLNAQMYYTTTAYNSVSYYFQDQNNVCIQPSGTQSMNRPNMKFTYTPNGPPTAQFTANPTSSCSGLVNFTDQSFYNVTSWLWNFGDGGTSTSQNPTHTYSASGTYSVSLKATNSNGNNTLVKLNYISVNLGSGPIAPTCTPTTTAWCCGFGITNFKFHNINNTTADGSEGYKDFSCGLDTVTTGQTYSISITTPTPSSHNVRVWIDYNNDGTFNPTSELVFSADNSFIAAGTVFIPGTATLSTPLRMRVSADHSLQPVPTPCSNPQFGQAEDYAIWVKPNTNPPVAKFSANDTISCSGVVQFTDQSLNVPVSWLWSFGNGATSALQNPSYTYTASGTYSVSLKATNANGNHTLIKTNYLDITLGNIPVAASCQPPTFSYCCGYGIYKVQVGAINRSSPDAVEGYKDFSCTDKAIFTEGQGYPISIQTSPSLTQDTKVWIDFDNNGIFHPVNELVLTKLNTINPSGTITVPQGVAVLNTILRMRVSSENSGTNQGPCTSLIKGQAEDYGVKILQFVGIQELAEEPVAKAFPNPSNGLFTIQTLEKFSSVEILNVLGEKVHFYTNNLHLTSYDIDLRSHPGGIYFYKIKTEDGKETTGKIVIE